MSDALRLPLLSPPPDRGRLLKPGEVAAIICDVSEAWVRRNVPHKLVLGHSTIRWFERDVREWLAQCRDGGRAPSTIVTKRSGSGSDARHVP